MTPLLGWYRTIQTHDLVNIASGRWAFFIPFALKLGCKSSLINQIPGLPD